MLVSVLRHTLCMIKCACFLLWQICNADYIAQVSGVTGHYICHSLQWQQQQIQQYCEKYHLADVAYQLPTDYNRENLFRHILLDDSRKLLFCFVPKVHVVQL